MFIDDYMKKDPRRFFHPVFEYGISEFLSGSEKKLKDIGFKYRFIGRARDVSGFVEKGAVIVGFGDFRKLDLGDARVIPAYRLFSGVEAGQLPVVHSNLLFNGCPHPLADKFVFDKIKKKGFIPMLEGHEEFSDFVIRFRDVFVDWSPALKALMKIAREIEKDIQSRGGLEELYSVSQLLGSSPSLPDLWERINQIKELPKKPDLSIVIT